MDKTRHESTQDRALTHSSSRFLLALIAVWSFGFGVLVRDVAQDYRDAQTAQALAAECKSHREHAEFYARTLAHLLNEKSVVIGDTTAVSCKTREWRKS